MSIANAAPDRFSKSAELLTQRLSLIRAIYIVSVASNGPPDDIRREFHQAVGDILEGLSLPNLNLALIDRNKVHSEVSWLREKA
jgi:hypothetical protein